MKAPHERIVIWHRPEVTRAMREALNRHKSLAVLLTGLPSSGKSTVAHHVEKKLYELGVRTYTLDGDNVRHGLCSDLGFSESEREENLRRVAEVAKLFVDAGIVVLCAFVAPLRRHRELFKNIVGHDDVIEVYCRCPLEVCERRDPKGMYARARAGLIENYTGISAPYEEPDNPDLVIDTHIYSVDKAGDILVKYILEKIKL